MLSAGPVAVDSKATSPSFAFFGTGLPKTTELPRSDAISAALGLAILSRRATEMMYLMDGGDGDGDCDWDLNARWACLLARSLCLHARFAGSFAVRPCPIARLDCSLAVLLACWFA